MNTWRTHVARLEGAYAKKTIESYENDFARFAGWCRKKRFKCLPATPETIAKYIDEIAVEMKVSTIKRRLCAIRKLHQLAGHRGVTDDETVLLAVRRAKRSKPGRPRQALGVTAERRDRMLGVCRDDLLGLRDRVLLSVGFDTLCRRSELVAIRVQDLTKAENGNYSILIRRAKNDQEGLGRTAHLSTNASRLIDHWLAQTGLTKGPLLRPVYGSWPGHRSLCAASVGRILKDLARQAAFKEQDARRVSGHSLRVGAAQSLTKRGVGILPIMSAGGWKSMSVVARYVENVEMNLWD